MQKWLYLIVILTLSLAACGGNNGDEDPTPAPNEADITDEVETETGDNGLAEENFNDDPEAFQTPEVPLETFAGQVTEPGARALNGLSVVSATTYSRGGAGWIALEVQNDNETAIARIEVTASLLDSDNRQRDFARAITPFQNIPSGAVVPIVLDFNLPEDYSNFLALADVLDETRFGVNNAPGVYDLPATLDALPSGDFPAQISGSITNNSAEILFAPTAAIAFYNAAGDLVGVVYPLIDFDGAGWQPNTDLRFDATIIHLSEAATEARIFAAGYSQ